MAILVLLSDADWVVPVTPEAIVPDKLTALVALAGVIFAVPSKLVPPIVLAVASAVAVFAFPVVFWLPPVLTPGRSMLADPLKLTPQIVLAVVKVAALPVVF